MKKRNREINVFSVSALDLFASALGAFILMSLVFMVFFTMTSQEPGQADETLTAAPEPAMLACPEPDPNAGPALAQCMNEQRSLAGGLSQCRTDLSAAAGAQQALAQCEGERAGLAEELTQIRIPDIDIVICLDITGSMRNQISGLKQEIVDLARVLDSLAPSAGIGAVAYGDRLYTQPIHRHPIVPTTSMASLRDFINALQPGIGQNALRENPDIPEALDAALAVATTMNWRPESARRYIIVVADAPPYPGEIQSAYRRAYDFAQNRRQPCVDGDGQQRPVPGLLRAVGALRKRAVRQRRRRAVDDRQRAAGDTGHLTPLPR